MPKWLPGKTCSSFGSRASSNAASTNSRLTIVSPSVTSMSRGLGEMRSMNAAGWYSMLRNTDSRGIELIPAEVESALAEHPAVECAVVVGLPDDDLGQRVHAVVQVLRDDVTVEDLLAF